MTNADEMGGLPESPVPWDDVESESWDDEPGADDLEIFEGMDDTGPEQMKAPQERSSVRPVSPGRWKSKGSRNRRGFTIHGYIGANGHGKSLAMMHDTKLSMDRGRPILSTVRVIDPVTGEDYWNYIPFRRWSQLLEFEGGDVLMDEVLGIAASEQGKSLPKEVQLLLNQLRRRDVLLRWTAPAWQRANVVLREVTQAVTVCRGYWPKYENHGDDSRMWGSRRLFRWTTYDAMEFTTWTDNKEAALKGKVNAWLWRPGSWAERSYDTFDSVDHVDSGEGLCLACGGERPKLKRPACSCPVDGHA